MAGWKSTVSPPNRLAWAGGLAVGLMLIAAAVRFPAQTVYLRESWPAVALWAEPEAQRRALFRDFPYDLLRRADAALPPGATVLLVTSGQDARRGEYTAYHRALYYLAPRPVWWLAPAPPDGTWESRWWISSPVTPEAVRTVASDKHADYVLTIGLAEPLEVRQPVAEWGGGALLQLTAGGSPVAGRAPRALDADVWWPARLAGAIAALFAVGYAVVGVLRRFGWRAGRMEAAALAWILGSSLASLAMFWLDALGLPLGWQVAAVTLLAAGALVWLRIVNTARPSLELAQEDASAALPLTPHGVSTQRYLLRFTLSCLLALQIALTALLAVGRPLIAWDSWANWGVKARTILLEGGITTAGLADPSRAVTHPDYPLMMPLLEAWLYAWLGAPDDRFAGLVAVASYLATIGIVYAGARRFGAGPTLALAAAVGAAAMPHFALQAGFAFADVPLAALAAAAAVTLAGWLKGGSRASLIVAALAAGAMPWAKREGWVLLAALWLAAIVAGRASPRAWKAAGLTAVAAAGLSGPWWAFAARFESAPDFLPVSLGSFTANAGRLPVIGRLALAHLAGSDWLFVWPLAAVLGIMLLLRRGGLRILDLLPVMALAYLAAMALAFVFSNYAPYQQHVLSSWPRLAAQVAPLLMVWLAARWPIVEMRQGVSRANAGAGP